jgi:hypothetical protein
MRDMVWRASGIFLKEGNHLHISQCLTSSSIATDDSSSELGIGVRGLGFRV